MTGPRHSPRATKFSIFSSSFPSARPPVEEFGLGAGNPSAAAVFDLVFSQPAHPRTGASDRRRRAISSTAAAGSAKVSRRAYMADPRPAPAKRCASSSQQSHWLPPAPLMTKTPRDHGRPRKPVSPRSAPSSRNAKPLPGHTKLALLRRSEIRRRFSLPAEELENYLKERNAHALVHRVFPTRPRNARSTSSTA